MTTESGRESGSAGRGSIPHLRSILGETESKKGEQTMKVKLEKNYKDFYTVSDYESAKAVIELKGETPWKPTRHQQA